MKRETTTELMEIQRTIRSYFEILYSTKLENLKEMDNFPGRCHIPKLNQDQTNNLNRPIILKEIETVINSLPNKKKLRVRWFQLRVLSEFQRRVSTNTP